MLPLDEIWRAANFLNDAVVAVVDDRLQQRDTGGLVKADRLRRNLLSSQPLCFNLFGYLAGHPHLVAQWLRSIGCDAAEVTAVRVEWAPPKAEHFRGGSAFDAFIEYRHPDEQLGFVGIETKYAEHLPTSDVAKVRETYKDFTVECEGWRDGAVERLDRRGRRQLWLNTLLAQSLERGTAYVEGRAVVCSCAADRSARELVDDVRAELVDPQYLTWHPFEEIVAAVQDPSISEYAQDVNPWAAQSLTTMLDLPTLEELSAAGDRLHDSIAPLLMEAYATTRTTPWRRATSIRKPSASRP